MVAELYKALSVLEPEKKTEAFLNDHLTPS